MSARLSWLSRYSRMIPVYGDNVQVLKSPNEFYETILEQVSNAKNRISISSLYLGTGELERKLVHTIESRLHNQSNLKCDILLDYLRGTRGCPNSVSLFTDILQSSQQLRLYLYHTPLLKGVVKRLLPERFNEVFGLQHTKILLVDNNVLLTGANLSVDYFNTRRDRYILFHNSPQLANYVSLLLQIIANHSYQMVTPANDDINSFTTTNFNPLNSTTIINPLYDPLKQSTAHKLSMEESVNQLINNYTYDKEPHSYTRQSDTHSNIIEPDSYTRQSDTHSNTTKPDSYTRQSDTHSNTAKPVSYTRQSDTHSNTTKPDSYTRQSDTHSNTAKPVSYTRQSDTHSNTTKPVSYTRQSDTHSNTTKPDTYTRQSDTHSNTTKPDTYTRQSDTYSNTTKPDTYVFPLVQMAPYNIRQDEQVITKLLSMSNESDRLYLASGYFNLPSRYLSAIINNKGLCAVLAASPKANGFYGANGVAKYVPYMYIHFAKEFLKLINKNGLERTVKYYEYEDKGWTYHCKGYRSLTRDLEFQVAIVTENKQLQESLDQERRNLYDKGIEHSLSSFVSDDTRRLSLPLLIATKLLQRFV